MSKFSLPIKKSESKDNSDNDIDLSALEAFAAGAKEKNINITERKELPWDRFSPEDPPRYNVSVRLNDFHLEMLRYIAKEQDTTQQRVLRKHLIPVIQKLAEDLISNK